MFKRDRRLVLTLNRYFVTIDCDDSNRFRNEICARLGYDLFDEWQCWQRTWLFDLDGRLQDSYPERFIDVGTADRSGSSV